MRKLYGVAPVVVALCAVGLWNYFGAERPIAKRLSQDDRNEKVSVWGYYRYGLVPSTLVVDLRSFTEQAAMVDVLRALLQSAEAHKADRYDRVLLAYKGTPKFQLEGAYFQRLGAEFETQNPVYTMRTLPENVFKLDGSPAYGTWTGGMLGVLNKQMEDLKQFSQEWYLDDALKSGLQPAAAQP
jgi:hypothetical protein